LPPNRAVVGDCLGACSILSNGIGRLRHRASIALLLLATCACYPKGWLGATPELATLRDYPFTTGPYLVALDRGRLAVVIKHDLPEPPVIEWWMEQAATSTDPADRTSVTAESADGLWIAELVDLPSDVNLSYRVRSTLGEVGPFDFRAGVSRGLPFRFAALGDTRTGHDIHRRLVEAMARENIDFVINSGDLVEFGGVEEQWDLFFRIEAPLVARRPMLAAIGNHDESPRRYFEQYFVTSRSNTGERYYYVDWGDVRVVIMDSESECRRGSDQYVFVDRALADAAAKDMLSIVSLHYPPYSSGTHGSHMEMRSVVGELAPKHGVELVLAGHDHDYERTVPIDGVTYIVAASAGATIRKMSPSAFSKVLRTEPHYLLFDVDRGSLVGRAINLYGDTFDSFVIPPNPPR
jgi:acid phosphatase type 7